MSIRTSYYASSSSSSSCSLSPPTRVCLSRFLSLSILSALFLFILWQIQQLNQFTKRENDSRGEGRGEGRGQESSNQLLRRLSARSISSPTSTTDVSTSTLGVS